MERGFFKSIADETNLEAVTKFWYTSVMAKNTSVALGDPFVEFARRKVDSGEFGSTSEVVREAMRRYIAEDTRREALDRALEEGLASPVVPFDIDEWFAGEFGGT